MRTRLLLQFDNIDVYYIPKHEPEVRYSLISGRHSAIIGKLMDIAPTAKTFINMGGTFTAEELKRLSFWFDLYSFRTRYPSEEERKAAISALTEENVNHDELLGEHGKHAKNHNFS